MEITRIELDYAPRDEGVDAFHERTQRMCVWIAHRRRGKTVAIANDGPRRLVDIPLVGREHAPPRIAWMYPTRVRAKDIAWSYLKYYTRQIPGIRHIESELAVEFMDGRRFTLYGADGHRGVGQYLDGIYYDERDDIPERVIVDLAPTLADYGGFEVHAGMLRGRHKLWRLREATLRDPNVLNLIERASETHVIGGPELARLQVQMGEAAYDMQMECDPNAAIAHAIYGREMDTMRKENRLTRLSWVPNFPVHWFADIGHSLSGDDWAWWGVQFSGRDILLQDYFARTGELPSYYAQQIRDRTEEAGCALGWVYLPHDGRMMDRKGAGADDDLRAAGITQIKVVPRTPHLWPSINYCRALMRLMFVDEARCAVETPLGTFPDGTPWSLPSGIDCLDYYTKKEPEDGQVEDKPEHNAYSHGADALRTMSEAHKLGMIEGTSRVARESAREGRSRPAVLTAGLQQGYGAGRRIFGPAVKKL